MATDPKNCKCTSGITQKVTPSVNPKKVQPSTKRFPKKITTPTKMTKSTIKPDVNPPNLGPAPVVAVLGGGLSGLIAAYRLIQDGYKCVVFEGNPGRVGGRCWSKRFPTTDGLYQYGQVFENGGELIDNGHVAMKQLVQELRLKLDNCTKSELNGTERRMYAAIKTFDSVSGNVTTNLVRYPESQGIDDYKTAWNNGLKTDYNAASYPWTAYPPPGVHTARSDVLDTIDMSQYLDTLPGISNNMPSMDLFNQMVKMVYNVEWSGEPWDQNSLNLHSLLPTRGPGKFRFWGESNEKFHVRGGNSQVAEILEQKINEAFGFSTPYIGSEYLGVKRGHKILEIVRTTDGKYQLKIEVYNINNPNNPSIIYKTYDRIISAIPPTVYRNDSRVGPNKDFSWYTNMENAGLSTLKKKAINEIGFGPIAKINVSFNNRFWNTIGWNGENNATTRYARYLKNGVYTGDTEAKVIDETQMQQCWDVTRGQSGVSGILANYYIGDYAALKYDGLQATGRVINGQLDTTVPIYESSKWNNLQTNKNNLNRFLRQLNECDTQIGQLAQANLNKNANGEIISAYESKNWWYDEFTRGAFDYYKPNQLGLVNNGFAGVQQAAEPLFTDASETVEVPVAQRNFHFAGSWADYDWCGWMEGAIRAGERCATEVESAFRELGYAPNM